jgi:hypothetical protein
VKACVAGSLPRNRARAISMILAQVSGWSAIVVFEWIVRAPRGGEYVLLKF